jgi:hypothetical protein
MAGKKLSSKNERCKKNNGKIIAAIALAMGMALAACSQPTGGGGPVDNSSQTIRSLPNFEGTFVASEQEASQLALASETQITRAISAAAGHPTASSSMARAITQNGHFEYNGVKVDAAVSSSGSYPSHPYSMSITESGTIDGTYGGYKINGNFDIKIAENSTSASASTLKYTYSMVYAVSHNGKGMKIVYTGDMTITRSGSSSSAKYDLHYAVYDNANQRRFNYDYKTTLTL